MTPAGWTIMIVSIGCVAASCAYCLYRVVTLPSPASEHLEHTTLHRNVGDVADEN